MPVTDMASIPRDQKAKAAAVKLFSAGQNPPDHFTYIGPIEGYSCKHMLYDPPSSMSKAIEQMRIHAVQAGADAVTDFSCTNSGTDAYGTNCWNAVQCGGTGIKLP